MRPQLLRSSRARFPARLTGWLALVAALVALVLAPRASWAQQARGHGARDAGAPPAKVVDAGADANANADAGADASPGAGAEGDGGTNATSPPGSFAAPTEPTVRIPPTEAERADGLPIAKIEISRQPPHRPRGHPHVPAREASASPSTPRASPATCARSGTRASSTTSRSTSTARTRASTLRFLVRERPNIKAIEFSGNDEIENDKLNEAVEIKPNTILSVPAVRRSVQKIKDAYAEKGYFLADVDYDDRRAARQRGHRQVQDRRAPAGHRPAHHLHRQRPRLRRRAARGDADRQRRLLRLRLRRPVPAGRLRARRPDDQRALLRQGLPDACRSARRA